MQDSWKVQKYSLDHDERFSLFFDTLKIYFKGSHFVSDHFALQISKKGHFKLFQFFFSWPSDIFNNCLYSRRLKGHYERFFFYFLGTLLKFTPKTVFQLTILSFCTFADSKKGHFYLYVVISSLSNMFRTV